MMRVRNGTVLIRLEHNLSYPGRFARHALFAIGRDLMKSANHAVLHGEKTGRLYKVRTRSGRTRRHRASDEGESHANLSGTLRRSMGWKVRGSVQLVFGYGVTRNLPKYAHYIEFTLNRPTLWNAIQANNRNIEKHLGNALEGIVDL